MSNRMNMVQLIKALKPILEDFKSPEVDTLLIKLKDKIEISGEALSEILVEIFEAACDECDVQEDGWIRLWWD